MEELRLEYFLSEKQGILVVAFLGALSKATEAVVARCQGEIEARNGLQAVVLTFHDIERLEPSGIPSLVRLQRAARERAALRLCFLKPAYQKQLMDSGAVRPNELEDSLINALRSLRIAGRPAA
jgi:anti-anti-sigma regulatory factor